MRIHHDLTPVQAQELIKILNLTPKESFSLPEDIDQVAEYEIQTGYFLPQGHSRIVLLTVLKQNDLLDKKCVLEINCQSLGLDRDLTQDKLDKAQDVINKVFLITGLSFTIPQEETLECADCKRLVFKKHALLDPKTKEWACEECCSYGVSEFCSVHCRRTGRCDQNCG